MAKNRMAAGTLAGAFLARPGAKFFRAALGAGGNLLLGLLFARAAVFGGYAPFGVAAAAAGTGGSSLLLLAGAALGYLLPDGPQNPVKYVTAAAIVVLLKWLIGSRRKLSPAFEPCAAGLSLAACSGALWVGVGFGAKEMMYCMAEALLCGCAVVFFRQTLPLLHKPSELWSVSRRQMVSGTITLCVVLLAFEGAGFGGLSLGRILGILAVLLAARYGREAGGGIAGVSVGMLLSLGDHDMAGALMGYGFGGLLSGVFAPLGRFGCSVAFILASTVSGLYFGSVTAVVTGLYEAMIATVVFLLLPDKLTLRVAAVFAPAVSERAPSRVREEMAARLSGAAGVMESVAHTMDELTGRLGRLNTEDVSTVFTDASELVCKRCGMRHYCWQTACNDTMDAFNNLTEVLRDKHEVAREDVPEHFAGRCCRLGALLAAVNRCYAEYLTRRTADSRALILRRVLAAQYGAFGGLLQEQAADLTRSVRRTVSGAENVRMTIAECGLEPAGESCCQVDSEGRLLVEARIAAAGRSKVGRGDLVDKLSVACGRPLGDPVVEPEGDVLRVTLLERPALSVHFGRAVLPKNGEKLCGDSSETFLDGDGHAVMLISDGMGCGGPAAVESGLAASLMSRMLHAGFGFDTAMGLVNSAMMMKSGDESFATFDILNVNLYNGAAEFLKAGAPASYIRRGSRVERVQRSSMPAGILQGVRLERTETRLSRGDLAVLVSDGVVSGEDDGWLMRQIAAFQGDNMRQLAAKIAAEAEKERDDGHADDITVLVAALH